MSSWKIIVVLFWLAVIGLCCIDKEGRRLMILLGMVIGVMIFVYGGIGLSVYLWRMQ